MWKFLRYNLVLEYESKPILPPPLIFICHIYLLIKSCVRRCRGKREYLDNGLSESFFSFFLTLSLSLSLFLPPFFLRQIDIFFFG